MNRNQRGLLHRTTQARRSSASLLCVMRQKENIRSPASRATLMLGKNYVYILTVATFQVCTSTLNHISPRPPGEDVSLIESRYSTLEDC
jgi:hypothetical protein